MGKTYHKFNLSYGWEGLYYKFRNFNGRHTKDILISTNPEKIFKFGGYDYKRYVKGFDDIEEIFDFAINSSFFNADTFKFDNLRHIDKKRNRKRGSYHKFLKYVEEKNIKKKFIFNSNKDVYLLKINSFFPEANLLEKLNELNEKDKINKIISKKFNGDIVMSWLPNLQGKELGNAIKKFRQYLGDNYKEFILNSNYNEIKNLFMEVYYEN